MAPTEESAALVFCVNDGFIFVFPVVTGEKPEN